VSREQGGILMYFAYRVGSMCVYYYDPAVAPLSDYHWSTYLLRWQAWFLVMDYIFYSYHRATHEVRLHLLTSYSKPG
jgi:sterol desaturase/sphingolipid hydroxylase (fatty acid hydroxylase superfamily)